MPSIKLPHGYVWPVTTEGGGLQLFNSNKSSNYIYHYKRSRMPQAKDILLFYSDRKIIGCAPVTQSARPSNYQGFKYELVVDFSKKTFFNTPVEINSLVNICRVLKGKKGKGLHDAFRMAPILSNEETKQIIGMGLPFSPKLKQGLTIEQTVDLEEDISELFRGKKAPERKQEIIEKYIRNQKFVDKLKEEYKGICQICLIDNLIETDTGYYSEGHHVIPLGDKGYDSLDNIVILCPLCHKKLHYSKDRESLKEKILYSERHLELLRQLEKF